MISEDSERPQLASLSRHFRVRLLNCSSNGCLFESHAPLPVGAVGVLQIVVAGRRLTDVVQIIRCQAMPGSGGLHHVAARLLPAAPPYPGSLRHAMRGRAGDFSTSDDTIDMEMPI